jgi:hypothetical protein
MPGFRCAWTKAKKGAIMAVELKKRVPRRVAVFSFYRAIFGSTMTQKSSQQLTYFQEKPAFPELPSLFSVRLSHNAFFGTFLFIAVVMTGLLFASGRQIANIEVVAPQTDIRQALLESRIQRMVTGHPIEQMSEIIAKENKTTAAFLIGIAKKESNWGKRVPRAEDGSDCFNYWGYRGAGSRGIAMGHGCFGSPEEAVGIVGGRLDTFVNEYKFRTAEEMVVWKCGWSCDGHSNQSVKKWIADVGYYTRKFDKKSQ